MIGPLRYELTRLAMTAAAVALGLLVSQATIDILLANCLWPTVPFAECRAQAPLYDPVGEEDPHA